MIIYNVTINIDDSVHNEWLEWMRSKHIAEVVGTGCFTQSRILKLIGDMESGGHTYAIQYTANSLNDYNRYNEQYAGRLRNDAIEKFGDKFVAFRTLLEVVE